MYNALITQNIDNDNDIIIYYIIGTIIVLY